MRETLHNQGFSLPELMVATVILAVVMTGAMLVFTTQHRIYLSQGQMLAVQQDARLVTQMMIADVRAGGFLVPKSVGLAGIDGGASAPDLLCMSDPSVLDEAEIDSANARLDGARLDSTLGNGKDEVQLTAASVDIDGDGDDDFVLGAGIIISDGSDTHCARITALSVAGLVATVEFAPATPGGFSVGTGPGRAVPAVIYELNGTTLRRNSVLLSDRIENIQGEYAIDLDDDGTIEAGEFPVHDMTASNPSLIRGLRLTVIARTPSEDPDFRSSGMPAIGNHNAGGPDGFVRRRFSANATARNL